VALTVAFIGALLGTAFAVVACGRGSPGSRVGRWLHGGNGRWVCFAAATSEEVSLARLRVLRALPSQPPEESSCASCDDVRSSWSRPRTVHARNRLWQ
jgi:hypothetical protein